MHLNKNLPTPTVITDSGHTVDDNSNISDILFDHRPLDGNNDPVCNDYAYDSLNRLDEVDCLAGEYGTGCDI